MAKNRVDGIYTADPRKDPSARRYARVSHQECIDKDLRVMDGAAFSLCRENAMPILVFDMTSPGAIARALLGEADGTLVADGDTIFA
jgi:uridylate kinase